MFLLQLGLVVLPQPLAQSVFDIFRRAERLYLSFFFVVQEQPNCPLKPLFGSVAP